MTLLHTLLLLPALVLLALGASADEPSGTPETAPGAETNLQQLDWMVGDWVGDGFGGVCEEIWYPASGGAMIGMFRLVVDGEAKFYEFMTLAPGAGGPSLRLKHFNPDLTGWEEKAEVVEFPFVAMDKKMIEFGGLTYERTSDSTLRITVALSHGDKKQPPTIIDCHLER